MSRINIPIDALTSRFNLQGRFDNQTISSRFQGLKPLGEFFDFKRLSKPASFAEVQTRVNHNIGYFSANYTVLFLCLTLYLLLTHWLLSFVLLLVAGGLYGIKRLQGADLDLGFVRATTSQLYTTLLVVAVPLFIFSGPIAAMFWLVGASAVTILGHASFMEKDIASSFSEEAV